MHQAPIFRRFDVRLAVSDVLRSTPTTPSVIFTVCIVVFAKWLYPDFHIVTDFSCVLPIIHFKVVLTLVQAKFQCVRGQRSIM